MVFQAQNILWPTDFSELSAKAIDAVRCAVGGADTHLHMLHVIAPTVSPDVAIHGAFIPRDSDVEQQIIEKAVRHMKDTGEGLCGLDRLTCHAEVSTTWPRICSYAEEHDIDLIVLATHGLTGLKHVLIGSVAERVVQHAKCPVLVVK